VRTGGGPEGYQLSRTGLAVKPNAAAVCFADGFGLDNSLRLLRQPVVLAQSRPPRLRRTLGAAVTGSPTL
jgi:hypothetical protein